MKKNDWINDPVFQLNLILWMTKPQPEEGYQVKPFFHENGFKIYYIETPFPFPEETLTSINSEENKITISSKPEPDVIIGREKDGKSLYFESKSHSFGEKSSNAKQAYGHLLACGTIFGEVLSPLKSSLLCYLVPHNEKTKMKECLRSLSKNLKKNNFDPGLFSTHGLSLEGSKIIYSWDTDLKKYLKISKNKITIIDNISEYTNPSPLILIFSDEDCNNSEMRDFYRKIVINQIHACLLCELHSISIGSTYKTIPDEILDRTSGNLFQYLGKERQKGLRYLIFENIFKKIFEHWKDKQKGIQLEGKQLTVSWNVQGEKDAFLDWLEDKRTSFSVTKPIEQLTPDLFENL